MQVYIAANICVSSEMPTKHFSNVQFPLAGVVLAQEARSMAWMLFVLTVGSHSFLYKHAGSSTLRSRLTPYVFTLLSV